jgi:alpha-galactosidase
VLFVYCPAPSFGRKMDPVRLRGLDPAARYRDEETGREYDGAVLMGRGIAPDLPSGDYASAVVVLSRVS